MASTFYNYTKETSSMLTVTLHTLLQK